MPTGLSKSDLADQYGYALAFLKSDKSLWNLFNDAVKQGYTDQQFAAKLKNTPWFKKNGESARQYYYLQQTDPQTLRQREAATMAQIQDAAARLGASISGRQAQTLAKHSLMFGWNDAQVRNQLTQYVKAVNGVYHGSAKDDVESMKQAAWRNGVQVAGTTVQWWARQIASGNATADDFKAQMRKQAASLAPSFADQLHAGQDLYDIAQPYIQAKAKILEMNPSDIDLFDNDVRGALSSKGADGKPASKSLWQYEQDLRNNPAWNGTQNAQDQLMAAGHQVLRDFGFSV